MKNVKHIFPDFIIILLSNIDVGNDVSL